MKLLVYGLCLCFGVGAGFVALHYETATPAVMVTPRDAMANLEIIQVHGDRDPAQVRAFRAKNPCPATGKTTGACPGWVVDHAYPFCAEGPDRPSNMRWQNYPDSLVKDRVEVDLCRVMHGLKRLGPLKVQP